MIVVVVLGQHDVPPIEAVLAPVSNDVVDLPYSVLGWRGEEEAAAATIHTHDLGERGDHHDSLPGGGRILRAMRVVAGEFGGRRLVTPEGRTTRPTTDRVREAIFNSLGSWGVLDGALVVDLFAGSGAVGIEALSRGAERCTFVERDRHALEALEENIEALDIEGRCRVLRSDSMTAAKGLDADIVFADPPYDFDQWDSLLTSIRAGLIVAESGRSIDVPDGIAVAREKRYGRTWVSFLEPVVAE